MSDLKEVYNSILLPGREEEAKVLMLSLVSKQHCVLIAPPGTAKSLLISQLAKQFDVPYFEYLLTKFTLPEEVFGLPNIKLLREQGKYELITTQKLPEARLAFLDEIFKASSAILNTLLQILNERKFFDGTQVRQVPLWTCLAASNEVPSETELAAFYDRFQYRHFFSYLPPERWEELLDAYWTIHQPHYQRTLKKFDFTIIEQAHQRLWSVNVFTVKKQLLDVFAKLADQGIMISDRRKGRCLITLAACAILENRDFVKPEDLLSLKYTIPSKAEEVRTVEQIIIDVVGERLKARQQLAELLPQLRGLLDELERARSMEEALQIAGRLKPLRAKWSDIKAACEGMDEAEEAERLLKEFSRLLAKKVMV